MPELVGVGEPFSSFIEGIAVRRVETLYPFASQETYRQRAEKIRAGIESNMATLKASLAYGDCTTRTISLGDEVICEVLNNDTYIVVDPGTRLDPIFIDKEYLRNFLPNTAVQINTEGMVGKIRVHRQYVRFPCFNVVKTENGSSIVDEFVDLTVPLEIFQLVISKAGILRESLPCVMNY